MSSAQVAYVTTAPAPELVPTKISDSGHSVGGFVSTTFTVNWPVALDSVIGDHAGDRRDLVQQEEVRRRRHTLEHQVGVDGVGDEDRVGRQLRPRRLVRLEDDVGHLDGRRSVDDGDSELGQADEAGRRIGGGAQHLVPAHAEDRAGSGRAVDGDTGTVGRARGRDVRIEDPRPLRPDRVDGDVGRHGDDRRARRLHADVDLVRQAALAPGAAHARVLDLRERQVAPAHRQRHRNRPAARIVGALGESRPSRRTLTSALGSAHRMLSGGVPWLRSCSRRAPAVPVRAAAGS